MVYWFFVFLFFFEVVIVCIIFVDVTVYRIHYVVGNACVKVWATKIISEFQHYLEAGEKGIEGRCTYLADEIAGRYAYVEK